jgi:protein TonB
MNKLTQPKGTPPQTRQSVILVSGLVCTFILFLMVVFTQKISGFDPKKIFDIKSADAMPPPPPPPVDPPPPPEVEEPEDKPELQQEQPKLNLAQLEAALNPGMGSAVGDFSLNLAGFAAEDLDRIFELTELDRRPQQIHAVAPVYPHVMQRAGVEGRVIVRFVCDKDGRVQNARVRNSSRMEFEKPALDAIRQWRFEPGVKSGVRVAVNMELPLSFTMNDR